MIEPHQNLQEIDIVSCLIDTIDSMIKKKIRTKPRKHKSGTNKKYLRENREQISN